MVSSHRQIFRFFLLALAALPLFAQGQPAPTDINFTRQGVRRFIFDEQHAIPLAALRPAEVIGMSSMYPVSHYSDTHAQVTVSTGRLLIGSDTETHTAVWFGGFNPFATYTLAVDSSDGEGAVGFEFADADNANRFAVSLAYRGQRIVDVKLDVKKAGKVVASESIATSIPPGAKLQGKVILQLLGSGLTVYTQHDGGLQPIAQADFSPLLDLRAKRYLHTFQSRVSIQLEQGAVAIDGATGALTSGMGLADIRAMTYEDGSPLLDQGRLWYTMTIRGRALPHHVQGVFSMDPTVFDLRFEGIIVFDRADGILRNEVASHIFYDRRDRVWRGITTGFSAYANPKEHKQLLAVESTKDPRFGFSVMQAEPFGVVGDIEDPHILYDAEVAKWRILTCENIDGYKSVLLESASWNKGYRRIAGPVAHNSTGTSIQRIGGVPYCFSGSSEREIFIYSYPDLNEVGTLKMDLPPWDDKSGTRVWPNVVELPAGYPFRYVALMMDRFNYPGLVGPNWTYGALYLYHGNVVYR
ncbi:hypothetical protein [Parapedobacter sp. 10938]|uniref:hypothetical protein n=1 Tax=Parapedobacter flavus TaxID=3110225 RepID=UPI002DB64597|nr:hypothetical protein [Parapedobacter sp. 10938]MEC3880803.1 hypothetical protein [Parapedobacter sp. 10938]